MNTAKSHKEEALSALLQTKATLLGRISVASSRSSGADYDGAHRAQFFDAILDEERSSLDEAAAVQQHTTRSAWSATSWDNYAPASEIGASQPDNPQTTNHPTCTNSYNGHVLHASARKSTAVSRLLKPFKYPEGFPAPRISTVSAGYVEVSESHIRAEASTSTAASEGLVHVHAPRGSGPYSHQAENPNRPTFHPGGSVFLSSPPRSSVIANSHVDPHRAHAQTHVERSTQQALRAPSPRGSQHSQYSYGTLATPKQRTSLQQEPNRGWGSTDPNGSREIGAFTPTQFSVDTGSVTQSDDVVTHSHEASPAMQAPLNLAKYHTFSKRPQEKERQPSQYLTHLTAQTILSGTRIHLHPPTDTRQPIQDFHTPSWSHERGSSFTTSSASSAQYPPWAPVGSYSSNLTNPTHPPPPAVGSTPGHDPRTLHNHRYEEPRRPFIQEDTEEAGEINNNTCEPALLASNRHVYQHSSPATTPHPVRHLPELPSSEFPLATFPRPVESPLPNSSARLLERQVASIHSEMHALRTQVCVPFFSNFFLFLTYQPTRTTFSLYS
jgi:hypothetical protein